MKKLLLVGMLVPMLALAADPVDGVPVGGIVLGKTDGLALKKQVLSISRTVVNADYELLNETTAPIEETITFALPEYAASRQPYTAYYGEPAGLTITVDEKPVVFKTVLIAKLKDVDVTAQLRKVGLTDAQIAYNPAFGVELAYNPLSPSQEQQLAKLKLWSKDAAGVMGPAWTVRASYVWKQKFPVKQAVHVHHVYRPFVSAGAGTWDFAPDFSTRYCADKTFMSAWKRAKSKANKDTVIGNHVHYLLMNSNNWTNGIEDFTLNVSKLDPAELVTLCFPGEVHKADAKTYRFHQYRYKPKQDLNIYFGNLGQVKAKENSGIMPTLNR